MALFTASIASGSNGNCYYIGNQKEAVLIDVGISCREIEKRMSRLNLRIAMVKAVFITHEHTDHIRGLATFSKKYGIPVFMTLGTWETMRGQVPQDQIFRLIPGQDIQVGDLRVSSFSKYHDAAEPISILVSSEGLNVGVFTDIGQVCDNLIRHFSRCQVAYLECNYDVDLLQKGRYPYFLKKRIQGGYGHLSNVQALDLLIQYRHPELKLLIASHLSRDNNSPEIVKQLFDESLQAESFAMEVVVASRDCETALYKLQNSQVIVQTQLMIEYQYEWYK